MAYEDSSPSFRGCERQVDGGAGNQEQWKARKEQEERKNQKKRAKREEYDVLIIGSGIGGMVAALKIAPWARVCLLTKDALYNTNTWLAQGGIAAALGCDDDPRLHLEDTLQAGAGLCHREAAQIMLDEAPQRIRELLELGVPFDRQEEGVALTREGAHSRNRVLHAGGDATGRLLHKTLQENLLGNTSVTVREHTFVTDLLTGDGRVLGVQTLENKTIWAGTVIIATGGLGRIFLPTTNPRVATGDGVAMAYRAGATLTDMEFIQFHPTALQQPGKAAGDDGDDGDRGTFLISEAVRGEGAVLRNKQGERFMERYHHLAEMGPRDVVSRAILEQMQKHGSGHVYLDITHRPADFLKQRFPTICRVAGEYDLDPSRDWLPVAPAAHYTMGGIKINRNGETNLEGLYACGEAACSGAHGANRLASNSLLEGLVFACRIAEHIEKSGRELQPLIRPEHPAVHGKDGVGASEERIKDMPELEHRLREMMFRRAGIIRREAGLREAKQFLEAGGALLNRVGGARDRHIRELQNMFLVARFIVKGALMREESRGSHYREDFPGPDSSWLQHICQSIAVKKEEKQLAALTY